MIERRSGRIISIGSRGAYRGEPLAPAYGASKAGLHALSQSLAKYLGQYGILVTAVAPGFVETDMTHKILAGPQGNEIRNQSPLGRVATPEEVAHTVLFLAAPGSEWLTGGVIDLNGASYLR
jgi:3-oxoacyl-[acyl-carrier protein] reductase